MTAIGELRHRLVIEAPVETPEALAASRAPSARSPPCGPRSRRGDALLFRWRAHLPAKHAAILVEPNRVVHARDEAAVAEVYLAS